jgi:hypothetical protein
MHLEKRNSFDAGDEEHAADHGETNSRHSPDAYSNGQALDDLPAKDDCACTDEPYATGHLRSDTGGLIGAAIWSAVKPLYKEAKRQERAMLAPSVRRNLYVRQCQK